MAVGIPVETPSANAAAFLALAKAAATGGAAMRGSVAAFGLINLGGDSLVAGGYAGSDSTTRAARNSRRYRIGANYAVGGKRTDQILAEQIPTLTTNPAPITVVNGMTNDLLQGYPTAGTAETVGRANMIAIWNALIAAGSLPIDLGNFPNNTSSLAIQLANDELWKLLYCARNGIPHVHVWPSLATSAGGYASGYNFDATHPNSTGADIAAARIIEVLDNPGRVAPFLELIDRAAASDVVTPNAVSFGGAGAALPSGYFAAGSGGAYSVVAADTGDFGNWIRTTLSGAGSNVGFTGTSRALSSLGWAVGDRIAVACRVRWSATTATGCKPTISLTGVTVTTTNQPTFFQEQGTTGDMVLYYEATITAGTTINFQAVTTATEACTFDIQRPIIYNLTKNGLA